MIPTARRAAALLVASLTALPAAEAAVAAPPSTERSAVATERASTDRAPHRPGGGVGRYGHDRLARPLVIAHRGASGYRPEHTEAAYELAVEMGADVIEPDLVMTRDGVLVDRHEPEISGTTDVADHPELADRRTTKLVDGVPTTGWFVEDLTLAELKTLRAKERLPQLRPGSARYDGRYEVLTFEETLRLRERLSREHGRTIGIIPEIKHSTYLHAQGLDPEAELVRVVRRHHLDRRNAPLWVQSFELSNLRTLREQHRFRAGQVFLTTAAGGPFDLRAQGTTYAELTTSAGLRRLARWVDVIGPEKAQVIPRRADGSLGTPTRLVADAHAAGLEVTPWTFRAENAFLPTDLRVGADPAGRGRLDLEVARFLDAGVDGLFCDQPDVCAAVRAQRPTTDR